MKSLAFVAPFAMSLAAACARDIDPPAAIHPGEASFAKGGGSNATAIFYIANDASPPFQGDGVAAYLEPSTSPFAGMSRYADGECGVVGTIFSLPAYSGDGHLTTQGSQDRRCSGFPRKVRLVFSLINVDGTTSSDGSETVTGAINLHPLELAASGGNPGSYIEIGTSQQRVMHLSDATSGKCYDGTDNGGLAFRILLNTA